MRFAAPPDRTTECPCRGRWRSFADRSLPARPSAPVRPSKRMTPDAVHQASAARRGREWRPSPAPVTGGESSSIATRPVSQRAASPQDAATPAHAVESISRIPEAGWKTASRPRADRAVAGPRPEDARARRTNRGKSPVAPTLVQVGQNFVQLGDGLGRRSRGRRPRWRQHAGTYRVGLEGVGEDRARGLP